MRLHLAMHGSVEIQAQCLQGRGIGVSATGMIIAHPCDPRPLVPPFEECGQETEVATGSTVAIVVDREHRHVDAEVPLLGKTTPKTIWTFVAGCPTKFPTFRSWFSTRVYLGKQVMTPILILY
jgi:hypothetical protein